MLNRWIAGMDRLTAQLWGLTDAGLQEMQEILAELG